MFSKRELRNVSPHIPNACKHLDSLLTSRNFNDCIRISIREDSFFGMTLAVAGPGLVTLVCHLAGVRTARDVAFERGMDCNKSNCVLTLVS